MNLSKNVSLNNFSKHCFNTIILWYIFNLIAFFALNHNSLNHNQFECEEVCERTLSEDEFETDAFMCERFVVDDDEAGLDIFSDCENIESDSEYTSEHCYGQSDDMLFAGAPISSSSSVVLLLSFVFKHNLTR